MFFHFWCQQKERSKSFRSSAASLNFKANDDNLKFDNNENLDNANDNYSGGLVFVGLRLRKKEFQSGLLLLYLTDFCQPPIIRPIS